MVDDWEDPPASFPSVFSSRRDDVDQAWPPPAHIFVTPTLGKAQTCSCDLASARGIKKNFFFNNTSTNEASQRQSKFSREADIGEVRGVKGFYCDMLKSRDAKSLRQHLVINTAKKKK